jgi:protein involved in polysaccharide export with SLBB domain
VNVAEVINGQRRADDPELQVRAGDTVFIPSAKAILRGEVKAPGEKAIGATDNLWDFISSAGGGFTDAADRSKVQIIRGDKVVRTVDFTQLTRGAGNGQSPELEVQPGDIVFVPNDEPARFAIVGGVKNPGRYPARPGMTLLDAVAAAGGFTDKVTHKQFVIAPADSYDAEGKFKGKLPGSGKSGKPKKEDDEDLATYGLKVVEYKRLIKGDPSQNVVIRPGDRVLIPEDQPDQKSRGGGVFGSILRLIGVAGMFGGFGL